MTDSITPDPRMTNALDFAGLAQMRAGAVQGEEKVTKEVAQQFESIFINMMLKSMRDATERSGLLDSEATKTYESMFDQQMSTELAGKGTFGIAQALLLPKDMVLSPVSDVFQRITAPSKSSLAATFVALVWALMLFTRAVVLSIAVAL